MLLTRIKCGSESQIIFIFIDARKHKKTCPPTHCYALDSCPDNHHDVTGYKCGGGKAWCEKDARKHSKPADA